MDTPTPTDNVRRVRRRLSTPEKPLAPLHVYTCNPLSPSLAALDLSSVAHTPALASLRILVLNHLAELETHICNEFSVPQIIKDKGEVTVAEAKLLAKDALEMLRGIRDEVKSHLPELPFDAAAVEELLQRYMHDLPRLDSVREHMPELATIRSRLLPETPLADMRTCFREVRSYLADIPADMHQPLTYLPTLSTRLQSLHNHLSSVQSGTKYQLPSIPSYTAISHMLDSMSNATFFAERLQLSASKLENPMKGVAHEVARTIKQSLGGSRLVTYVDLPHAWRNNHFVNGGYRFIPLEKWHLLLLSVFMLHNETINIHTHMIPLLHTILRQLSLVDYGSTQSDPPELWFITFASFCLFSSVLWHTMSGCAHQGGMELCARVDYVGIGWLISATIGTVVYYGFRDYPVFANMYLALCLATAVAGSVFPFMDWFNDRRYKMWRVGFFLTLAFTGVAPCVHLAYLYSFSQMFSFIAPLVPSLASYVVGLCFYVSHFPECCVSPESRWSRWTDWIGGGSHAIWHAFIVLAIYLHLQAMRVMREGITI